MFYQLRYIFLFFFLELALIGQAYGYQESTKLQDSSTYKTSSDSYCLPVSLADQRDFREIYEPSESNETSKEDKEHASGVILNGNDWGAVFNSNNRYKNLRDVHRMSIHELPLFVLFHAWKFHIRFI